MPTANSPQPGPRQGPLETRTDNLRRDGLALLGFVLTAYFACLQINLFDVIDDFTAAHESWQANEIFSALAISAIGFFLLSETRKARSAREWVRRNAAERRARTLELHDVLTGLPNRYHLQGLLDRDIALLAADERAAVVIVEVERFTLLNDIYGHRAGDALICQIAGILREETCRVSLAARIGGARFALVVRLDHGDDLDSELTRLLDMIERNPIDTAANMALGVRLGVAIAPTDGSEAQTLIRRAEVALHSHKHDDPFRVVYFEPNMDALLLQRAQLERDLAPALRDEAILPYLQPQVCLRSANVAGYEILARWRHAELGMVPPDQFIPIAEECGLIGDLTLSLLHRACLAVASQADVRLAINVPPTLLHDPLFAPRLLATLAETGFPPQRLEVEITESALVSNLKTVRLVLKSLQDRGVQIALDDFGTGYSSLQHLRDLPVDKLKIDKSFIRNLANDKQAQALVKAIVMMAEGLGLSVIAEGVETREVADVLRRFNCHFGQGYYLGRPAPITALLDRSAACATIAHRRRDVA